MRAVSSRTNIIDLRRPKITLWWRRWNRTVKSSACCSSSPTLRERRFRFGGERGSGRHKSGGQDKITLIEPRSIGARPASRVEMIQSLVTLKLLPGLNHPATKATSGRGWPTRNIVDRGGGGIGTRRRCANVREAKATSSSLPTPPDRDRDRDRDGEEEGEEGASSAAALFLFRSQTYALLKQQMAVAAKFEVGVASPGFFFLFLLSLYPDNLVFDVVHRFCSNLLYS